MVEGDVRLNVYGVGQKQVAQEGYAHRLALEVVDDVLAHVAGADAVVDRVVIPLRILQQVRERRLADAGHAEYGDGLLGPAREVFA